MNEVLVPGGNVKITEATLINDQTLTVRCEINGIAFKRVFQPGYEPYWYDEHCAMNECQDLSNTDWPPQLESIFKAWLLTNKIETINKVYV